MLAVLPCGEEDRGHEPGVQVPGLSRSESGSDSRPPSVSELRFIVQGLKFAIPLCIIGVCIRSGAALSAPPGNLGRTPEVLTRHEAGMWSRKRSGNQVSN